MTALALLLGMFVTGAPGTPVALAQTEAGRVYVANAYSDTVAVMDAATHSVITTVAVGDYPVALAVTPDGTRVYVANEQSNTVSVIDTATNAVVATVPVGVRPRDVRVTPDGREVSVANSGSPQLSIIDTATNTVVGTVTVEHGSFGIAFSPDGSRAYVTLANDSMAVVNTATRTVITTVPVGHGPHEVEVLPDGSKIYVADSVNWVRVVDAATLTVVATIPIGRPPDSLAVHPDGTRVYVGTGSYVSTINTATDTVVDTAVLEGPRTVAISPTGDRLYTTTVAERVIGLDPATLDVVAPEVFVGLGPEDMATATLRQPVIGGSSWHSTGAKSRSGPAGTTVSVYAVGAAPGVPYRLVLSRTPACADLVAYLNPTTVVAGPNGLIGT
ncbi:MAG: PQQ-binding-like beta-propeller repeat protein, partial [Actinobacteria bacterium]|nr:PQQ-binding-like beta-propeller repeat protein [Actinomycetota bacterium]